MTLRDWCDGNEHEPWQGLSSAFRAGARARITGAECNYVLRADFGAAWLRGHSAMDAALAAGTVIAEPEPPADKTLAARARRKELRAQAYAEWQASRQAMAAPTGGEA